jgi:LysM repeat protein
MYEVQSGDVLGIIALNHKISLNDLLKNNPNVDVNGLIFP